MSSENVITETIDKPSIASRCDTLDAILGLSIVSVLTFSEDTDFKMRSTIVTAPGERYCF